jgi:hypothetical protein
LNRPLNKFIFLLNNVKFLKINLNQITFAINKKNIITNKFILFFKELIAEIKKIFSIDNVSILEPWKEAFNYPYLLNVFIGKNFIILDNNKNTIDVTELNYDHSYSILIEISYIKYYGNINEKKIKFKLSILMIQIEPDIDYKSLNLLKNIPQKNLSNIIEKKIFDNISVNQNKIPSNTIINLQELLEKRNSLKSIQKEECIENNNNNIIDIFLNKKSELKKVKTNEKSLFNKLKKKSNNKKKALLELELEKELNLLIL